MTRIVVRGGRTDRDLADLPTGAEAHSDLVKSTVKSAFDVEVSRGGGSRQPAIEDAAPDDVLELTLSDGVRMWTSVVQMQEDQGPGTTRGDQRDELIIKPDMFSGEQTRGAAAWALQGLRLLGVDLAQLAAEEIAEQLENRLEPGPGLYLCPDPTRLGTEAVGPGDLPTDRAVLILLHGTASRTSSSFADFVDESPHWAGLKKAYGDEGIFAFEHNTLSQSPIENACELVESLPDGARIHLLSHSRGGLVGELLCRVPATKGGSYYEGADREIFKNLDRTADLDKLTELDDLLRDKRPTIGRFVRVACPVRGTLLASKRLDRYLSVLTNLMGLVLPENPAFDLVSSLVLAVAKQRTEVDTLPGLEAMMPSSPLVAMLNRPGVSTTADLSVIAGDLEGRGFLGRLKTIATDIFYREDHDLVVNTAGMHGGARRDGNSRHFSDQGSDVNHFRYFKNHSTASRVVTGLTRPDDGDGGFTPDPVPVEEIGIEASGWRGAGDRPVAFVLPGIMGSHLSVDDDRIWLDPIDLALGGLARLAIAADDVTAVAPLGKTYGALIKYLGGSHDVVAFPFDWRISVRAEGARLAGELTKVLDHTDMPVRLLAHSMGGLVARAMIADHQPVWERMKERPGCRLIMLGTPNGGSWAIPRVLLGHDRMVRMLALIDARQKLEKVLDVVSRFPGMLEMLPVDKEMGLFSQKWWGHLRRRIGNGWSMPGAEDLAAAKNTREVITGSPIDRDHMVYVAGQHPETPCRHRIDGDEIRFFSTPEGDGRVPWATGRLPEVETFYMRVEHGRLPSYKKAFPALLELLQTGFTSQLPKTKPAVGRRTAAEAPVMKPDQATVFPTGIDLEAAAVGFEPILEAEPEVQPLHTAVVHGDLSFSPHVVAVGHYENDTIVGAEAALDRCVDNRLSLRRRLGVYPGPLNTSQIVFNPGQHLPGVLVVGLGPVGELSRSDLTRSFAIAVTALALKQAECEPGVETEPGKPTAVTALLIGSSEAGIGVKESVCALVEGVTRANANLDDPDLGPGARIEKLEIVELYLDRAVQAMHALRELAQRPDLEVPISVEPSVRQAPGSLRRVFVQEDQSWWRRLQIQRRSKDDSSLVFTDLVDRARADIRLVPDHRELLDDFIRDAMMEGRWSRKKASAMFELLLPNELKESLDESRDLLLSLDPTAAGYPWELLHDPESGGREPLAVRAGLMRQLATWHGDGSPTNVANKNILIIGDPVTCLRELPAARVEAEEVERLFESSAEGYEVRSVISRDEGEGRGERETDDSGRMVAELFSRPYRIMHIAAHGLWKYCPHGDECPGKKDRKPGTNGLGGENCPDRADRTDVEGCPEPVTGIVIGFDKYFKPSHVKQIRRVPELVFVNCCHSGRIQDAGRPELAANMAQQFIRQGARAVVAAGWPVHDDAAKVFASEFYTRMLANETFGRAVHEARRAVYRSRREHQNVNTWGAYQCYGDPDYVLDPRRKPHHGSRGVEPCSPDEVVCELENIANASATASVQGLKWLEENLDRSLGSCERSWLERADVLAAIGRASGTIGRLEQAIEYIEKALKVDIAVVPIKDLEMLAFFKARLGVRLARATDWKSPEADSLMRRGEEILTRVTELGETTERLRLLGSTWKRIAVVNSGEERALCLEKAELNYRKANETAGRRTGDVDPHSLFSWLICRGVRRWRGARIGRGSIDSLVDEGCRVARQLEARSASYWNLTAPAEAQLALQIMDGRLHKSVDEVVDLYQKARRRGASPFQIRSIRQHLELTAVLLQEENPFEMQGRTSGHKNSVRLNLARELNEIHDRLEAVEGS